MQNNSKHLNANSGMVGLEPLRLSLVNSKNLAGSQLQTCSLTIT